MSLTLCLSVERHSPHTATYSRSSVSFIQGKRVHYSTALLHILYGIYNPCSKQNSISESYNDTVVCVDHKHKAQPRT